MPAVLRSLALAFLLLAVAVPIASANEEWCSDDPPRVLITPQGNALLLYETLGAQGDLYVADLTLGLASTTYTATNQVHAGVSGTVFTLTVPIPNDLLLGSFADRAFASSLPFATGTIYASSTGVSGTPLQLTFWYPLG
jgi:hypothetical protein